jgi:hypothetical protein
MEYGILCGDAYSREGNPVGILLTNSGSRERRSILTPCKNDVRESVLVTLISNERGRKHVNVEVY